MTRAAVVVNPAARGDPAQVAEDAARELRAMFAGVDVLRTAEPGGGVALARAAASDPDVGLVVAVGGDGTAREVAHGIALGLGTWTAGGPAPAAAAQMLILPAGTGNSMHHALWSDRPWRESLALLGRGGTERCDVDLARISGDGQAVLLGASAGFLRWTVDATARFPHLSGRQLYMEAALSVATSLRPFPGAVSVDGRPLCEGPIALAAVGGAQRRGGSLAVLPRSVLDDGLLDVCVLLAPDGATAVEQLTAAMQGAHLELPGVHYAQGSAVTLRALDGPLPFEVDGDAWPGEASSVTLRAVPKAVPMVVPRT
ncbi:MAG TPA: diacylglycerol kinase family protein [Candidatus Dormibacteraeota bacterium]|nr:diacylglycerol kinase family protein [Candidatus Dormibacteraeota bacterium]